MSLKNLVADFALFDDWEERYRYIIELGARLSPLTDGEHNGMNKISGCVSQVWLVSEGDAGALHFRGDSDAHIVRGLIAILLLLYSGKSAPDILQIDAADAFAKLGLDEHLTPQRSNGFHAMVSHIRFEAEAVISHRNA